MGKRVNKYSKFIGPAANKKRREIDAQYKSDFGDYFGIDESVSLRSDYYEAIGSPLKRLSLSANQDVDLSHEIKRAKAAVDESQWIRDEIKRKLEYQESVLKDAEIWLRDLQRVKANIRDNTTTEKRLIKQLHRVEELWGLSNV